MEKKKILILGIGNLLMKDEGIGNQVIRELEKEELPGADLMDGGTGGFHLMGTLQNYEKVIIVDASLDNHPVGTIRILKPKFAAEFPRQLSAHEIGLKDLIDGTDLLGNAPEFVLVAVSVSNFQEMGLEISPEVKTCIPEILDKIRKLVALPHKTGIKRD